MNSRGSDCTSDNYWLNDMKQGIIMNTTTDAPAGTIIIMNTPTAATAGIF